MQLNMMHAVLFLALVPWISAASRSDDDDDERHSRLKEVLLVGETESSRITAVNPSSGDVIGQFIPRHGDVQVLSSPDDIVFDRKGDIYISSHDCPDEGRILKFSKKGKFLGRFDSGFSGLRRPYGIAFGPDGYMYVASFKTDQIVRYNARTGAFVDFFRNDLAGTGASGGFNGPDDLLFVGNDLYITTQGSVAAPDCGGLSFPAPSEILKADVSTGEVSVVDTDVSASEVPSLGFVSFLGLRKYRGLLYASDFAGGIRRYDLDTGARVGDTIDTCFGLQPDGSCNVAIGNLDINSDGELFTVGFQNPFGEVGDGAVLRFDAETGAALPAEGKAGALLTGPSTNIRRPIGVALMRRSPRRRNWYATGGAIAGGCAGLAGVVFLVRRRRRHRVSSARQQQPQSGSVDVSTTQETGEELSNVESQLEENLTTAESRSRGPWS